MSEREASDARRRAALRALPPPAGAGPDPDEVWVRDAPSLREVIDDLPEPRVQDLDRLLRDVDALRADLRRDLSLAATAAAAGERDLAAYLVLDDAGLRAFEGAALDRLAHLAALDAAGDSGAPAAPARRRRRRLMGAAPFAAAAAVALAFSAGVVPASRQAVPGRIDATTSAMESYNVFTELALQGGSPSEISAAAERFHDQLAPLLAAPQADPAAVSHAIWLLQSERVVLAAGGDTGRELTAILREADQLVAALKAGLAKGVRGPAIAPPPLPLPAPEQPPAEHRAAPRPSSGTRASTPRPSSAPRPTPTSSPEPSPAGSPAPQPAPTASPSPKPSPTPKPSPSSKPSPTPSSGSALPYPPP